MADATGVTATGVADQAEETAADQALATDAGVAGEGQEHEPTIDELVADAAAGKTIPAKRFQKVYDQLKLTQKQFDDLRGQFDSVKDFLDFIDDLKRDGINNSDDVRKFIANQNISGLQSQRTAAEGQAARDYHAAIAAGETEAVARKAYDLDMKAAKVAFDDGKVKIREAEIARASTGSVDSRIRALLKDYPLADEEVLRDLAKVPGTDLAAKAKRLHEKEAERQVEYSKKKTEQTSTKGASTKTGGNAAASTDAPPPNALKDPKGAAKWLADMKAKATK